MPICRHCKARISKFDKDICPVCGGKDPLNGVTSDTIEVTHEIDTSDPLFRKQAPRRKKLVFAYFAAIGWLGAGFVYLRSKIYVTLIWIICNLGIIGLFGLLLMNKTPLGGLGFLVSFGSVYLINIVTGLVFYLLPGLKDGEGELVL